MITNTQKKNPTDPYFSIKETIDIKMKCLGNSIIEEKEFQKNVKEIIPILEKIKISIKKIKENKCLFTEITEKELNERILFVSETEKLLKKYNNVSGKTKINIEKEKKLKKTPEEKKIIEIGGSVSQIKETAYLLLNESNKGNEYIEELETEIHKTRNNVFDLVRKTKEVYKNLGSTTTTFVASLLLLFLIFIIIYFL